MSVQNSVILGETAPELLDYLAGRTRFMQHLIAFCIRPETSSDVISGRFVGSLVLDMSIKLRDSCLNLSREIVPNPSEMGEFSLLFAIDNFQPEVAGISDVAHSIVRTWVPISSPLTHMVYLLVFELLSWLQKRFRPSVRPPRIR